MNTIEKVLLFLQGEMETPKPYGWYHLLCLFIMIVFLVILFLRRKKHSELQLKLILGIYSFTALIFELLKQIIWAFNFDSTTNMVSWDYEWYSFPFQLCTTPIYVCLLCTFLKNNKLRKSLLSYIAYFTILGSVMTAIIPDSCFCSDILVNIHTMWLHLGSLVVSMYLLFSGEVEFKRKNINNATLVFIFFILIAELLNIIVYNSGVLNGESFNMFYISPYFISVLPIYDYIQTHTIYIVYLFVYIISLILGANIVYYVGKLMKGKSYEK